MFTLLGSLVIFLIAAQACNVDTAEQEETIIDRLWDATSNWPDGPRDVVLRAYIQVVQPLANNVDGGTRAFRALCAMQVLVWVAWKVPIFQPSMTKYFTHRPLSRIPYTLLTSAFSHRSFIHLAASCTTLSVIGPTAAAHLTRQQDETTVGMREADVTWHFLAFYSSSCLVSSLVSHVMLTRIKYPIAVFRALLRRKVPDATEVSRFSRNIKRAADRTMLPSLGSSGAVSAIIMLAALAFPNAEPIPFLPIQLQWVAGVGVTMDIIGLFGRSRWVRLGGSAFGALYYYGGVSSWWGDIRKALSDARSW